MHDVLNATPASLSPKPALSPSLSIVASLLPLTHIPILRSPTPGYFLSHIEYTRLGTPHNGFKERPHPLACEIERRAGCSFDMSVTTAPCHFDECPSGFQSLMYKNIYTTRTALHALTDFLLSWKVEEMPAALDSLHEYRICGIMKLVAEHLGVNTITMFYFKLANTAHHSSVSCASRFSVLLLLMKDSPGVAMITQLQSNVGLLRSTVHSFVDVLWRPLPIHLNDTKNSFSEILTELTPSPVSFSLYYDPPGVLRLAQIDSNLITLHSTVTHFNSAFVAPVHTDPSVTIATIYGTQRACKQYLRSYFKFLADFGMKQSSIEPCLWYRVDSESEFIFIGVYSDDNLIVSKGSLRASFQDHFNAHYDDPHPIPLNWVHSVKRYASDDSCNRHKARLCYAQSFTSYTVDDTWSPMTESGHRTVDACADVPSITNHGTRFIPPAPPQL